MKAIVETSGAPTEAQTPDIRRCLLQVMQRPDVRLETVACCADVVAADARFNLRVATVEKQGAPVERLVDLVDAYDRLIDACLRGVATFDADGDAVALEHSLRALAKSLDAASAAAK